MTTRSSTRTRGRTNTGPHKTLRKRLLADLARRPGQPCARCGQPMHMSQLLDLDHTDDRAGYLGLSHRACNRRDGQRKTVAILNARRWVPTRRQWQAIAYARERQPRRAPPPPPQPPRSSRAW